VTARRTHDRTLLQLMGFSDPDLGSERHDFLCRHIAHPKPEHRVWTGRWLALRMLTLHERRLARSDRTELLCGSARVEVSGRTEVPIVKGRDQYRMIVGFADVVLSWRREYRTRWNGGDAETMRLCGDLVVEVKTGRISEGLLLRQMNTYREFGPDKDYAVAFDYEPSSEVRRLLLAEGFAVVHRVDNGFVAEGPARRATPPTLTEAWWGS